MVETDTIAYKLAHLYLTTKSRGEFVDEAFKLRQVEFRFTKEILELAWDAMFWIYRTVNSQNQM